VPGCKKVSEVYDVCNLTEAEQIELYNARYLYTDKTEVAKARKPYEEYDIT